MKEVAFVIPCFNEQESIGLVVTELQDLFPESSIYVCDNHSLDRTAEVARAAGAVVLYEKAKGKGNAVRRLLRDVEANLFVMVDGDNTYDLSFLPKAIECCRRDRFDLMTGDRFTGLGTSYFRRGHGFGNVFFTSFFRVVFGVQTRDVFSGLRIFSRRLVKTFPLVSAEFEIEAELTIYAARMRLPVADFPTKVRARVNSESKLSTYVDSWKILIFALRLLHREFPLRLYLPISLASASVAAVLFLIPYAEYLTTGLVTKIPTLVISTVFVSVSIVLFFSGLILKEISNLKYEQRYLHYLSIASR
ncbi:glycosyltransferase family 2 protein [Synechococcus sp. UW179B]|uniref:glycosyltransferase family 2 protein n=1 Tax=Synechococcus sp. UW179B TaxID=2575516 RepID=UPI000E0E6055|nr:glycosyltransferase family 2 protein [Synechococcus sp. UW179B]